MGEVVADIDHQVQRIRGQYLREPIRELRPANAAAQRHVSPA